MILQTSVSPTDWYCTQSTGHSCFVSRLWKAL